MTMDELLVERERLKKRLAWLGIRSDGSDRLERQIYRIEIRIAQKGAQSV